MPPSPNPSARLPWLPWPGAVVALVVVLAWGTALTTPYLANALGLGPTGPFLDLQGILAANEAAGRGLDPYALNPLDAYHRPFLYSTWWLWPGSPGLTRADTTWLGWLLVAATLVTALLMWRVRNRREALVAGLILLSPAWLLAVYRANNDLVIFVLLALAVWALQRSHRAGRAVGALLTGAMVILKYYPVAAIIGLLRAARRREVLVLFALVAGVVVLGWPSLLPAIAAISHYGFLVTASVGLEAFGVKVLGESLAPYVPSAVGGFAGLAAIAAGYQLAQGNTAAAPSSPEGENRLMSAAVFGAVLLGCFLIGTSYNYKLVFLWGLLPWLVRDAPEILGRKKARVLLVLLIAACWADGLVATVVNTLGPGWSQAERRHALTFSHGFSIISQLGYWVIMGASLRLALDWSRQQFSRLAAAA